MLSLLGATPYQGLPPFPDVFTGSVTVNGEPAPEGTQVVACVDNLVCAPDHADRQFQTQVGDGIVGMGGSLSILTAQGVSENQRTNKVTIHFFLINEHGRIKAEETANYGELPPSGVPFKTISLTFGAAPTPELTPTPPPTPTAPPPTATATIPPPSTPPPTPTAPPAPETALPIPGEPLVPQLAQAILYGGIALLVLGTVGLLYARRRLS